MGGKHRALIVGLVLAFVAGLALALLRADLAYIVRPAMGLLMIACGLFFIFGRVFEGPVSPDLERVFRRSHRGYGVGLILFGASHLLPMGWWSTPGILLAAIVMVWMLRATRREMAAVESGRL